MRSLSDDILSKTELAELEIKIDSLELLTSTTSSIVLDQKEQIENLKTSVKITIGISSFTLILSIAAIIFELFFK